MNLEKSRGQAAYPSVAGFDTTALDRYIEEARKTWQNVGVAVSVTFGDEVIYSKGFGLKEIGGNSNVDSDTLFEIGSTSKAFGAAAIGILVDEGKVSWDDPVIEYLPWFRLSDSWLTRNLTIRDALCHRSGISDTWFYLMGTMNPHEAVRQLRYIVPDASYRASFRYSNLMYGAAGLIVEAVTGNSWHTFVKQRLLEPLRMHHSGTSPYQYWDSKHVAPGWFASAPAGLPSVKDARDTNVAMPHVTTHDGPLSKIAWQSFDNAAAAGAVVSSASDMGNWMRLHLNEGRFEGTQILTKQTMHELHAQQNGTPLGGDQFPLDDTPDAYALGWQMAHYGERVYLSHGGGIIGFPAFVALLPDQKIGVTVLSNGNIAGPMMVLHKAIVFNVLDSLLGESHPDTGKGLLARTEQFQAYVQGAENTLRESRLLDAPPSLPLERYTGTYEDHRLHSGPINVALEKGALTLSLTGEGTFSAPLEHWHHDIFRLHPNPGAAGALAFQGFDFVRFNLNQSGAIDSISWLGSTLVRTS